MGENMTLRAKQSRKDSFILYACLLVYIVYAMRGGFYTSGSSLSKMCVVVGVLIGWCFFFREMGRALSKTMTKVHCLMIFYVTLSWVVSDRYVHGGIGEMIGTRPTLDFLKCFLYANLTFYTVFALARSYNLTSRILFVWGCAIGVVTVVGMFSARELVLAALDYDANGVQMAVGYVFATLMPYAFLVKGKFLRLAFGVVFLAFSILSAKRGAFILSTLLFCYMYYKTFIKCENGLNWKWLAVGLVVFALIAAGVYTYIAGDDFLMARFEKTLEGDASNREDMYPALANYVLNRQSFVALLFGEGMIQTVRILGNYAHNDWFESMIDFGIPYTILLVVYIMCIYRLWRSRYNPYKEATFAMLVSFVFKSIVSMGVYSLEFYVVFALLGFVYYQTWQNRQRYLLRKI